MDPVDGYKWLDRIILIVFKSKEHCTELVSLLSKIKFYRKMELLWQDCYVNVFWMVSIAIELRYFSE